MTERLETASGFDLDAIGNEYNVARGVGEPDEQYRDRIRVAPYNWPGGMKSGKVGFAHVARKNDSAAATFILDGRLMSCWATCDDVTPPAYPCARMDVRAGVVLPMTYEDAMALIAIVERAK